MKNRILLITEDRYLTAEIAKQVRNFSAEMEIVTASSQRDALDKLATNDFSLLIADFNSVSTNATELISYSKDKHPSIFRALIYEVSKKEKALYSSADIHMLIQNPLKEYEFQKVLILFNRLKALQLHPDAATFIKNLGTIPVLPDIYLRLEKEIKKEEVSIHRIADIISDDPIVAAKILHILYSSFFNISKNIFGLVQAINFLGLDIVKNLVLYVKIFTSKNCSPEAQAQLKHLRDHSIVVAKVAKAIMNTECNNRECIDAAYIAGLLHDIGKILIIQFSDMQKNLDSNGNGISNKNAAQMDFERMGVSHIDIGSYLLNLWNFPSNVVEAISHHHDITILEKDFSLKQVVFIANSIINSDTKALTRIKEVFGADQLNYWMELVPVKIEAA